MTTISTDQPGHIDQFGRVALARRLMNVLKNIDASPRGAVIGLEGEWGSGKTWVVRSLKTLAAESNESARQPTLRVVEFNPWMLSGASDIVEALLVQLAAEMDDVSSHPPNKGASLATSLLQYAGLLGILKHLGPGAAMLSPLDGGLSAGVVQGLSAVGAAAGDMSKSLGKLQRQPQRLSLQQARSRIDTLLTAERRAVDRWVVCVDDIDRLLPREVAALVQAVKAVADFPNVVYLLCYDRKVVARALESVLDLDDGQSFLEKIVQLPFSLPQVPVRKLNAYARSRLASIINIDRCDGQELEDLAQVWPLILALLKVPRDVERLRTRLLVVVPEMQDQVNLADVVLIEAVALLVPRVFNWILGHQGLLIGHRHAFPELSDRGDFGDPTRDIIAEASLNDKQKAERRSDALRGWESECGSEAQQVPVRAALSWLFHMDRYRFNKASAYRRLHDGLFWYRWRCFHDHDTPWEVSEVAELLAHPEGSEAADLLHRQADFESFCDLVELLGIDNLKEQGKSFDAVELAGWFVCAQRQFDRLRRANGMPGCLNALVVALRLDSSQERRANGIRHLIAELRLVDSAHVVLSAQEDLDGRSSPALHEPHAMCDRRQLADLRNRWRTRCLALLDGSVECDGVVILRLAHRLHQMQFDEEEAKGFLLAWVGSDDDRLADVLRDFDDGTLRFSQPPWLWLPGIDRLEIAAGKLNAHSSEFGQLLNLVKLRREAARDDAGEP